MRILVFGVTRCESLPQLRILEQWAEALQRVAPAGDHLIIDRRSPVFDLARLPRLAAFAPAVRLAGGTVPVAIGRRSVVAFSDDIGTLEQGGQDGWGRAFCQGLVCAVANGYDFAVHVEGGLLTRLDIPYHCELMREHKITALGAITPNKGWLEAGLVFLDVAHLRRARLIEHYDWDRKRQPALPPIKLSELLGDNLYLRAWRGARDNIAMLQYYIRDLHWLASEKADECDAFLAEGEWPMRHFGVPPEQVHLGAATA